MEHLHYRQLDRHHDILQGEISARQLLLLVYSCFSHFRLNLRINSHPSSSIDYGTNSPSY